MPIYMNQFMLKKKICHILWTFYYHISPF